MNRPISFEQAKTQFPYRYTMEHVPDWARQQLVTNEKFYAPQFRTDKEWYENTKFMGEHELATKYFCHTTNPSWPLGRWLDEPFSHRKASTVPANPG